MVVDDQLVRKLEKLSMLELSEDEKVLIKKDLNEIINFVENLNEIDVSEVDASFKTVEYGTLMREDLSNCDKNIINGIYKNAPKMEDNFFIVPQIIE